MLTNQIANSQLICRRYFFYLKEGSFSARPESKEVRKEKNDGHSAEVHHTVTYVLRVITHTLVEGHSKHGFGQTLQRTHLQTHGECFIMYCFQSISNIPIVVHILKNFDWLGQNFFL